jgi:cytochrome c556
MDKSLKYLVGISAIIIAGCAAYFSITGLGILFAGASVSVMIMAGSLEYAKLVTATYLKQKWDTIKGFNKWYLTSAVVILMIITSAGIFGYLSNAFQQQNIRLDQVQREIDVWNNKIKTDTAQITLYTNQLNQLQSNSNTVLNNNTNRSSLRFATSTGKEQSKIRNKISVLNDSVVVYNGHINDIKNNNIDLEREVGGFRFVAEAFGASLNNVVKFFIFLIVIVFDPLAIALVIAFNQLVLGENKKEDKEESNEEEDKTKEIIEEESRLKLSEEDLKKLEEVLMNPPPPNENLMKAAEEYKRRGELLGEIMKNDEELGLYDEPFDNPMIKKNEIDLKEIVEKLKDREELFPESNQRAKEIIENSVWDVTLMDGLEDEEPFFTEKEIENILQEEPTEEEIQQNFSNIEPETENISQNNETFEFDGFVPEPFATSEEVMEFKIDEDNRRMDIIGQNGNEGLHYENEENTSSEQDDEKKN